MKWLQTLSIFLIFSLLLTAQNKANWQDKIDSAVQEKLEEASEIDFFVLLQEQAPTNQAQDIKDKTEKAAFVFDMLKTNASRTQKPVKTLLEKLGVEFYQSFWVVNTIYTKGDQGLIEALAQLPEVSRILPNLPIQNHQPIRSLNPIDNLRGGNENVEWGIQQMRADELWDLGISGSGVVVGGQDTGYDWTHPALYDKYRGWYGSGADHNYNWHDAIHDKHPLNADSLNPCGFDSPVPCDDHSHGTHTVGTMVGQVAADDIYIGLAPKAKWIGCRNMERGWGAPASYIECFEWFLAPTDLDGANPDPSKAPHVIANSWGCPPIEGCVLSNFETMRVAVENLRNSGVVVVVSAGNDGPDCHTIQNPASIFGESFSVGASTPEDTLANFSSRGSVMSDSSDRMKPNVVAPGVYTLSSVLDSAYASYSGTSMAGPHVVGLVALLISAEPELAGDVERIEEILEQSAIPLTWEQDCGAVSSMQVPNNLSGYGRVDAWQALRIIRPELTNEEPLPADEFRIWPNPVIDKAMLVTPKGMGDCILSVYNPIGQLALRRNMNFQRAQVVDLSGLLNGVYVITVESVEDKKNCFSKKIMVFR